MGTNRRSDLHTTKISDSDLHATKIMHRDRIFKMGQGFLNFRQNEAEMFLNCFWFLNNHQCIVTYRGGTAKRSGSSRWRRSDKYSESEAVAMLKEAEAQGA